MGMWTKIVGIIILEIIGAIFFLILIFDLFSIYEGSALSIDVHLLVLILAWITYIIMVPILVHFNITFYTLQDRETSFSKFYKKYR
jgi:hypothetical protein